MSGDSGRSAPPRLLSEDVKFQGEQELLDVLAGVELDQLILVDRLGAPATGETPPTPGGTSSTWVELGSLDDVVLTG